MGLEGLEHEAILLHGEDRHAVGGEVVEAEAGLGVADRVGERAATGDDDARRARQDGQGREPGAQLGRLEEAAAELDDDGPGHEAVGSSSAAMSPRIWTSLRAW